MRNRLKELRRLHQLSQADLARKLVVSRQAINGFESGKFDPSLDMAFRIASLLNVKIEDIFIYEAKNPMQTLVRQVTDFLGLEFGFERFTDKAINVINYARNEAKQTENSQVTPEHLLMVNILPIISLFCCSEFGFWLIGFNQRKLTVAGFRLCFASLGGFFFASFLGNDLI